MAKPEQKKEEKYVMICPKCKSPDVEMDATNPVQPAFGLPPMYICHKCGHSGNAFPEVPISEIEEFEKRSQKRGID
jgi:ribosomal protein L37AE/L43A